MTTPTKTQIFFGQLASRVVRPVLSRLPFGDGPVALNLVLGIAAQESGGQYLAQYPTGPALGLWQIEPATHQDVWDNYLKYKPDLAATVASFAFTGMPRDLQLAANLAYACAICRLICRRAPEPLPGKSDPTLLGAFWKTHYNTAGGGGTADEFVRNFGLHIGEPLNA